MRKQATSLPALTERDITGQIVDYLHVRGAWLLKTRGGLGQRRGVPDIVCCIRGLFVAIEVKRPKGVVTAWQREELTKIDLADGVAFVARSLEDVMAVVEPLIEVHPGRNREGRPWERLNPNV